jgi:hypothetical protein
MAARSMSILGMIVAAAAASMLFGASQAARETQGPAPALVLLRSDGPSSFASAVASVTQAGARPVHLFPPSAMIVLLPRESPEAVAASSVVREVYSGPVGERESRGWDLETRLVARAWNQVFMGLSDEKFAEGTAQIPLDDALEAPVPAGEPGSAPESNLGCPSGAQAQMVSEFMLGSISLNVILPQSTGAVDPSTESWNEAREALVLAGVVAGTQWLTERGPQSPPAVALSFTYHLYSGRLDARAETPYEPISRPADPAHEPGSGEGLWANEILNEFGYSSYPDRWTKARAFDDDTRKRDGTNWAATVFVVDSLNAPGGHFTDGRFAYTWQPGSHIVMTYDNSGWGISRLGSVFSHELCHAFWAKDEYSGSGCSCKQTTGYLDGDNGNCAATCSDSLPTCVMRSADLSGDSGVLCSHTAKQIGWTDADANGVPDSVQALPLVQLDSPVPQGDQLTLTGQAQVQAAPNLNPSPQAYTCPITVASVARVEARVDGGAWEEAFPPGGGFSGPQCAFTYRAVGLAPGPHAVEVRATDTLGQAQSASASFSIEVTVPWPPQIPDGSHQGTRPMLATPGEGGTINLQWDVSCPVVNTNVYYGFGSGLPAAPGAPYRLAGSECGAGNAGSSLWSGSPDPASDASRFVWWVLVATDGIHTEGSWGKDSNGQERNGNQASGLCGFASKNTTNLGCSG